MYWIHFQNIYTFAYQKTLLYTFLLLVFKIVESLQYIRKVGLSKREERLNRCIGKCLEFCKLKIIFQTGNRLPNYLRFKDCVPGTLQFNFVYKFKFGSCTASYYSKTYRHMKVRVLEHQGVSLSTSVRDHMLNCDHTVAWKDFSIIRKEANHYFLETEESLFVERDNPSLNRSKHSQDHVSRIIFVLIVGLW